MRLFKKQHTQNLYLTESDLLDLRSGQTIVNPSISVEMEHPPLTHCGKIVDDMSRIELIDTVYDFARTLRCYRGDRIDFAPKERTLR